MSEYHFDKDADGIVTITFDASGKSANTMTEAWLGAMDQIIDRLCADTNLTGVVLASAKKTFFAGGDLEDILSSRLPAPAQFDHIERNKRPLRMLEKLTVPVVAAINGAALGGGFEICLACNHRVIVDNDRAVVGLPEVTLGLLPGAGGIVRLVAKLGLKAALPYLLEGNPVRPRAALEAGLVDEIVAHADQLIPAAKAWIRAHPNAHEQPWDRKGFRYPGGDPTSPAVRSTAAMAPTMLYNRTRGLMPAPERIVDLAVNSMRMGFDSALRAESRGLVALIPTRECKAAISTFFFGMQAIKGGKGRPTGAKWTVSHSAVLGAGMMGAGIAWAQASRGITTTLKDRSIEMADAGKSYSARLLDKRASKGAIGQDDASAILDRITPVENDRAIAGVDIIIEAVFEDLDLKERVIAETFPLLGPDGIYGTNTSSLPISVLAEATPDPSRFIGLHFFSPVDKMKIVEIIRGRKTSDETLRKAYDYVLQIGYLPIIVNDSRGFFTSRVFGTYLDEGLELLRDGMNPVAIERAAWKAGMPVGPLAVHDEVSLTLSKRAFDTHKALDRRLGEETFLIAGNRGTCDIAFRMIELGRGGRHYGGGFYEYGADGSKTLWDGLAQFQERELAVSIETAVDRLLYRQAIETIRCLDEGVLNSPTDADIGSIVAIGFPKHTGGALQFVHGIGLEEFQARANTLADLYGDRFRLREGALDTLAAGLRQAA